MAAAVQPGACLPRGGARALWIMTGLARAASAAKEVLLAMAFGTTPWKDALVVAWTVPTLLATCSNETLPALLTPAWAGGRRPPEARRLVWLALLALAGLSAAAVAWPGALVRLLAPALRPPARAAAVALARLLAVNILLLGAQSACAARLNAGRRFGWAPAAAGLPALGAIVALALSRGAPPALRVLDVAWGLTAGGALALALLAAACLAALPARAPAPPAQLAGARASQSLLRPFLALLLAMLVLNLVPLAERMAASALRSGSLAAYDYGERLVRFVFGLSVAPFTALSFTRMAELAPPRSAPPAPFAAFVAVALRGLLTLAAPLAVMLAVFAPLITRCVYGWGRFGANSLAATLPVVAIQGGGLALDAAVYFLLFASFARRDADAKLPLALVLAAVNIPLAFLWSRGFGLAGLAAAHVAGSAAALGWYARRAARRAGAVPWRPAVAAAAQAGGLTLAAALAVRACLPAGALTGRFSGGASWAWLALALAMTAAITLGLARRLAPGLAAGVRAAFAGAPPPPLPAPLAAPMEAL